MSTGTRSKRTATHEVATPAKVVKVSNDVGQVNGRPFSTPAAAGKTKGKGEACCNSSLPLITRKGVGIQISRCQW